MLLLSSPAKANLYFKVLSKREDGYHEIQTEIVMLDLKDTLTFSLGVDYDLLTCNQSEVPLDHTNLVLKALYLFKSYFKKPFFIHIHLEKIIPMQAGLGGGSSNAATTLFALNQLHGSPFSEKELILMAAQLGADVPCFFSTGRVVCQGIGEKLSALSFEKTTGWIAKPKSVFLSTPSVFKELCPEDYLEGDSIHCDNHLEKPTFRLCPVLYDFKKKLETSSLGKVVMTGSGSSFFCFRRPEMDSDIELFKVTTLARKPLQWY